MPVLVMKFGGTSVATLDRIKRAAKRVGVEVSKGYDVIVIVHFLSPVTWGVRFSVAIQSLRLQG